MGVIKILIPFSKNGEAKLWLKIKWFFQTLKRVPLEVGPKVNAKEFLKEWKKKRDWYQVRYYIKKEKKKRNENKNTLQTS